MNVGKCCFAPPVVAYECVPRQAVRESAERLFTAKLVTCEPLACTDHCSSTVASPVAPTFDVEA